jgi:hypothetical protein
MNLQNLLPVRFFHWCEATGIGALIQQSKWSFAVIETIHIMALAVLLGSFLIVDLRLFGVGMRRQTVAEVAHQFGATSWVSFVIMALTGIPMYLSEAVRLSTSSPFFYKMVFLCLALVFHLTVHRKATTSPAGAGTALAKLAASLSLVCWLAVALAGRAIAFL